MADREPRRRKRRKDLPKRDDIRSDDMLFTSSKPETRDSDQEIEEEHEHHVHSGPNIFSKIVFFILFSGLIFSMGFIYISLQSADKGPVDLFDANNAHQEEVILHVDHPEESEPGPEEEAATDQEDQEPEDDVSLETLLESGMSTLSSFFSTQGDEEVERIAEEEEDTKEIIDDVPPESDDISDQDASDEYIEEPTNPSTTEAMPLALDDTHTTPMSSVQDDFSYSEPEDSSVTPPPPTEADEIEQVVPEPQDEEVLEPEEDLSFYENADITNENDYEIRDELDDVDRILEKSPEKALAKSEELLRKSPLSPRALYLKAQALDKLAEKNRSNKQLEEAIATYELVLSLEDVPEKLYLLAGWKAADRLRFRGDYLNMLEGFTGKSVKLLTEMSRKFPLDITLKNEVAVGYLLIGQNIMAKNVLFDVLKHASDSGFAKVHLGFILKTEDSNFEEAVRYLQEGIASREPGVIDGRFYFHLGDALHRLGRKEEAMKVYEEAVKEGLFLSVYQRSLYNVDGLTGKPWWDPHSTRYAPDFKILERNWKEIRDEGVSLVSDQSTGFLPEAEGLQERGDWKQLELFARGRKIDKNCLRAPKTCAIVSQIPDAVSCKRGQVKFSIMHPQTHVWAHTGPTNCRLRSHLGLVIPEGAAIRVADETRKWEEGKVILFDDSFEHEVWHNGSTYRLVLIVDFWHPELTAYQKRSLTPI